MSPQFMIQFQEIYWTLRKQIIDSLHPIVKKMEERSVRWTKFWEMDLNNYSISVIQ